MRRMTCYIEESLSFIQEYPPLWAGTGSVGVGEDSVASKRGRISVPPGSSGPAAPSNEALPGQSTVVK